MSTKQERQEAEKAALPSRSAADSTMPMQQNEADAIKRYVLLELVLLIIEHDVKAIELSTFKLPRVYESVLRGIEDRVLLDMASLRRMFRSRGIKIYNKQRKQDGLLTQYVCRGYHKEQFILWSVVKAACEQQLKRYMSQ